MNTSKDTKKMSCEAMESKLADLLLDPESVPAEVAAHAAECERCAGELAGLRSTMALMDEWKAPEPNPYFVSKLGARFREEREAAPAGWLERLKARFTYGPRLQTRPLAAMALTVVLLVGGGTYLGITNWEQPPQPVGDAAVVHDLQIMDNNADLLDQLETLSSGPQDGE